jgi:hypothetical protein
MSVLIDNFLQNVIRPHHIRFLLLSVEFPRRDTYVRINQNRKEGRMNLHRKRVMLQYK